MQTLYTKIPLFKRYLLILLITVSFQVTAQNSLSDTKVDSLLHVLHLPALDSLILITERATLSPLYSIGIKKKIEKQKLLRCINCFKK